MKSGNSSICRRNSKFEIFANQDTKERLFLGVEGPVNFTFMFCELVRTLSISLTYIIQAIYLQKASLVCYNASKTETYCPDTVYGRLNKAVLNGTKVSTRKTV